MAPDENCIPTGLPGGFFIYEAEGDEKILFAEQNVIELFGCKTMAEFREYTHNSFVGMVHPDDLTKIENDIQAQTFNSEKRHDYVRYRILTKQGQIRYIEDFGHLLHGADGKKYFYVYIVDVDADDYYNRRSMSLAESEILSSMSNIDRLTGLMSMQTFSDKVQEHLADEKSREHLLFAHFNVMSFKVFNEKYGFDRGDDLLCRIASTLRRLFPGSPVARLSNDHFVVCANMDVASMGRLIEEVHDTIATVFDGIRVDIKGGIYELEDRCDDVGVACDRARLASNTVKRRYDKVYGVYDAQLYESLRLATYVVDTVDAAIERGYLKVYYQPIIRVRTGRICGYEALARWDDPHMGFLPPSRFITTLEEYHMVHKVDCFVVEQVMRDLAALIETGEPVVPVSINISRLDFDQLDMFEIVDGARARHALSPSLIDIEITESALNDDATWMELAVRRFREAGYRIWIDDFGSGYSALNSLLDYEFDVLKLDLEFLRTYDEHPRAQDLIANVVKIARSMDVEPLQEGVESDEHLEMLAAVGCEMAQGYFIAKPMPLEASRELTRTKGLEWEDVGAHL